MPIVVATDFSPHAREAADAAVGIARKLTEALRLVHVTGGEPDAGEPIAARRDRVRQQLAVEADRLGRAGVAVGDALLTGYPDETIVGYADEVHARLIVTGALGLRTASWWRAGTVADRIAQTCHCPLLIVRSAGPFIAWARGEHALRIAVGDDLSSTSEAALRWLAQLKQIGPLQVTVVHIYWPLAEYSRLGYPANRESDVEAILQRDLRQRLDAIGIADTELTVRIASSYGRPADPLIAAAVEDNVDLLMVGTHQRTRAARAWHGSVSQVATHLAPMSVALVPAIEEADAIPPLIPPVRHVLVSTDFSPAGNLAIAHACSILPQGGHITLTHVIDSIPAAYAKDWAGPRAAIRAAGDEILTRSRLTALIPPDLSARSIEVSIEVLYGLSIPHAICQAAERAGADVICIGSHGRTGAARLVLGSVAQGLIARSARPVLVVKSASA
jgi:nucleotide-binding universal stress UspA family protein